jgi:signal transduction histidine kinase
LSPVWSWDQETRRDRGYEFYRNEVVTRRSHLLSIASEIGSFNEHQLTDGDRELDAVFVAVQRRLLLTVVLTLIGAGTLALISMAKLLALEQRASQHYQQAIEARGALQDLSARLVSAQEQERKAISRELHDEVGQSLSALLVGISNIRAAVRSGAQPELDDQLSTIRQLAEESVRVVRNMSLLLRPSMLDDLGLVAALQWQAREVARNHGLAVDLETRDVPDQLPEQHSICIYRVVQEALHNAARHSGAHHVDIHLHGNGGALTLSIRDDGKGFRREQERGLGLLGMQERVTHLGGSFQVRSEPGRGTEVAVVLPVGEDGRR